MSVQELRYLAYTSETLSKFLDKDIYQHSVLMLDTNVVEDIEMVIAEEIIDNYLHIRNYVKEARNGYLQEKNSDFHIKNGRSINNEIINTFQKNPSELYRGIVIQKAMKKQAIDTLDQIATTGRVQSARNIPNKKYGGLIGNKNVVEDPDDPHHQAAMRKLDFEKRNVWVPKMAHSTMYGKVTEKEYRHILHPQSKLLLKSEKIRLSDIKHTLKGDNKLDFKQIVDEYRLSRQSNPKLINNEKFLNAYSCGPLNRKSQNRKVNKETIIRAVITIQRFIRSFLAVKRKVGIKHHKDMLEVQKKKKIDSNYVKKIATPGHPGKVMFDLGQKRRSTTRSTRDYQE